MNIGSSISKTSSNPNARRSGKPKVVSISSGSSELKPIFQKSLGSGGNIKSIREGSLNESSHNNNEENNEINQNDITFSPF